jgi:HAD superfamily hydrolase (TIGR01509 family)
VKLHPPHGVLLDLDGTLVDTVGTRIEAWLRTFDEFQMPADRDFVAKLIGSDGKHLAREVGRAGGHSVDDQLAERIDRRSGEIYSGLNTDPRPLRGVSEFLDALEAAAIPWAIATSSRREQVGRSIEALKRGAQPRIVDGSSVKHAKPEPDLLLAAAGELGIAPSECWCVGDSTWDMRAAVAAAMTPVAVLAGAAVTADELRHAGAAESVATIDALIPWLSPET